MKLSKLIKVHLPVTQDDWKFTLIDEYTTNAEIRKREVYWQHLLRTFCPIGLNEREESCLQ